VTLVEADDQDCCISEPCKAVSSQLRWKAELQDALIERPRDNERKIEKSLRQLSRLLLDEIVKNLSRNDRKAGAQSCRSSKTNTCLRAAEDSAQSDHYPLSIDLAIV
jgi:hypothetical protein